jgi:non-specific serine/threonine protein kinase
MSTFVGREQELRELGPLLSGTPLLTLVGAGGVGKTRLAHALVQQHAEMYRDGCWVVELASIAEPTLLPGAIATAVGLHDINAGDMTPTLVDYLRPRQLLLLLDNCEHLVDACAGLLFGLLRACPQLGVVATSREPLAIAGEVVWQVPPLGLPDLDARTAPEQMLRSTAVRLFIERAQAHTQALEVTDRTTRAIARICVRLDGMPLAIELAAARTRLLTVEQLADRLDSPSSVLGHSARADVRRHETIRAALDWSYDSLDEPERLLLQRLSVFAGGCNLRLAEEICPGGLIRRSDVLTLLAALVDKSMVVADTSGTVARYRQLEPIRQFAFERLERSGDARTYRSQHAAALLDLAQTGPDDPGGPDEVSSLDRLETEHDNLRVALAWALTHGDGTTALRATAALFRFWERRGHFQEGCNWIEQALARAPDAPVRDRIWALNALADLYWRGGHAERGQPIAEQALTLSHADASARGVAWALVNLGVIAYLQRQPERALERLEQSVPVAREAGHLPLLSLALTFLARARIWVNGPWDEHARALLEESCALAEASESLYATGYAVATLGDLNWSQGDVDEATLLWQRALVLAQELADRRAITSGIERIAVSLTAHDRFEEAAWLFGAAEAQHSLLGIQTRDNREIDHLHFADVTHRRLGPAFDVAWAAGHASSVDDAVTFARAHAVLQTTPLPT